MWPLRNVCIPYMSTQVVDSGPLHNFNVAAVRQSAVCGSVTMNVEWNLIILYLQQTPFA